MKHFDNDAIGHRALIKWFQQRQVQHICLEATGVYHLDLAVALHGCGAFELTVLNPKVAHNYAKVLAQRSKNDALDAAVLAHYAQYMPCHVKLGNAQARRIWSYELVLAVWRH